MMRRHSRRRSFARVALGLLALTAATACGKSEGDSGQESSPVEVSVRTVLVTAGPFTETISAIGNVVPRPGHVAALSAPAPTRVLQVLVATGQHVQAGTELVHLDQSVFEASLRSATAAMNAADSAYQRAQRLVAAGIAPRKELDQAGADLALARANVVAANRAVDLSVLRSPFSGVVTRMSALLGASVDENQVLVEVADPTAADVVLEMTPADAGRVRSGAAVVLRGGQSTTGDTLGRGTVSDVGGVVDTTTRSVAVRVRPGVTRSVLRIGETVTGIVTIVTHANAITVPGDALVPEGEGFKVFVVDSADIAHARAVTVGARHGDVAQILNGLAAGERVVTYGAYGIDDGAKVLQAKP